MIRKIITDNLERYVYVGEFNNSALVKTIEIYFGERSIAFNLDRILRNEITAKQIELRDIQQLGKESNIKVTIYPDDALRFSKPGPFKDELTSCYVSIVDDIYIVVIAFDETQPGLYKAQLVDLFELI